MPKTVSKKISVEDGGLCRGWESEPGSQQTSKLPEEIRKTTRTAKNRLARRLANAMRLGRMADGFSHGIALGAQIESALIPQLRFPEWFDPNGRVCLIAKIDPPSLKRNSSENLAVKLFDFISRC